MVREAKINVVFVLLRIEVNRQRKKTRAVSVPPFSLSYLIMRLSLFVTDNTVQQQECEPTPEEKALLREEFISQMHQRFLDGKDKDFNYRSATPPITSKVLNFT